MIELVAWLGGAAILLIAERQPKAVLFTLSAFAFLTALFLLPFGDPSRAVLFALVLSLTIAGASAVKHHHSGMKLAFADLALTFAGTLPFMVRQYRRTAMLTFAAAATLTLIAILGAVFLDGHRLGWPQRWLVLATSFGAMIAAYVAAGGARRFRADLNAGARFFSFFLASIVDVASWWPTDGLRMLDVADKPLKLAAPRPARSPARPDIIVVQHESVFDPRLFGLAVDEKIGAFLQPPGGHSGRLHVDIYGGGSWQTEFSLLTGLSSASFGPDSYFLFRKGVGRFPHSLPSELAALGYRTVLATSCRRDFLNYDAFYAGIGVEERHFSDTYPPPFDLANFELTNSDADFFAATQAALFRSLDADPAPRFVMALTNFNHGPHETQIIPPGIREEARAFALKALPDPTYAEYYTRLDETAESWAWFKAALAARYPGRPMLFVRYGDHQPTMTRAIEQALHIPTDDPRQFETFFALEAVGFEPDFAGLPDRLDIAMLGTVALAASGLPMDAISTTRLSLIAECGGSYMASPSAKKRAFHRTLVERGAILLDRDAPALRIAAERAYFGGPTRNCDMAAYDDSNIFAKILRGEIPSHRVYEDDDAIAFMDVMPQGPGHVLVVPKAPSRNLLDADPLALAKLIAVVQRLAVAVKAAFAADGVSVFQFNEPAGGQTVFHLHFHVVPRFDGVALKPHTGAMEKNEILAEGADKIRAALG